ncbi:MAG: thioredoxin domain-containing protein [Verrucomicrobiaceae bacterium]|nr:thioredoxin domain-containing protein [Verrucomicrobiaceae bacterium]
MNDSGRHSSRNMVYSPLVLAHVLLSAAVVLSAWLGWQSLRYGSGGIAGCPVGSDCDTVLRSDWASVGRIPTAWLGAAFYLMQLILLGSPSSGRSWLICLLSGNLAAALFFTGVQAIFLRAWCPWCCSIHLLATAGAACGIVGVWRNGAHPAPGKVKPVRLAPSIAWSALAHLLVLGVLSSLMPTAKSEENAKKLPATALPVARTEADGTHWLSLHGGRFRLDMEMLPRLGSISARHLIVCITDPTCHHCRDTSQQLSEAWKTQTEGEVAIVFLPGTLDSELSSALQTALLILWRENPKAWAELSARLYRSDLLPTREAVTEAVRLALGGQTEWDAARQKHHAWTVDLIQKTRELMAENARVTGREVMLPQLQVESQILLGAPSGVKDLVSLTGKGLPWPAAASQSSEPCSGRKFCGNLTILFNGAGENLNSDPKNPGTDPAAGDTIHFLDALSQAKPKNTRVIVLSSDTTKAVKDSIARAKARMGSAVRHIPTSKPAFEQFFKNDAALESLKQGFLKDLECKKHLQEGEDISKYLKVDIFVSSHSDRLPNGKVALPVWPSDDETGPDEKHESLRNAEKGNGKTTSGTCLTTQDFEPLRQKFSEAVFHALPMTCDGAEVAEMILPTETDACSCYAAFTDEGVLLRTQRSEKDASISYALNSSLTKDGWIQSSSVHALITRLSNLYRWRTFSRDSSSPGVHAAPLFHFHKDKPNLQNHLDYYSVSSAEKYADRVLAANGSVANKSAPAIKPVTSDSSFETAYEEVTSLLAKTETLDQQYLSGLQRDPHSLKQYREAARDLFNGCFYNDKDPSADCVKLNDVVKRVFDSQKEDSVYIEAAAAFSQVIADGRELGKSELITKALNTDPMGNYQKFAKYWDNFDHFVRTFTSAAKRLGVRVESIPAMDDLTGAFALCFATYIHAYFPDIMQDTLKRRVEKMRKAADVLRTQFAQTGDPKYKTQLLRLRNHLACTLNFPYGPNYREVHEH